MPRLWLLAVLALIGCASEVSQNQAGGPAEDDVGRRTSENVGNTMSTLPTLGGTAGAVRPR